MINVQEIQQKIEQLREKYKNEPANRKIIAIQAKLLQFALEKRQEKLST